MFTEKIKLCKIKPYNNNAKIHTKEQIQQIVDSIKEFGYNDPIAVDENNIIIEGHGRWQALKNLSATHPEFNTIDVIRLNHLTDEQKRAYILAHNQLTMNTGFDKDLLETELSDIYDIDMQLFNFDLTDTLTDDFLDELQHEESKEKTQKLKENILNLAYAQFEGSGKYDIPQIKAVNEIPEIKEWIGFNYVLNDKSTLKEKSHKGVHFFIDDYQFERVWNSPDDYIEKLLPYGAVLSPDFSPYGDMPLATQIFNHYRKHWLAVYWQNKGVKVIPTIRASTDPRSFEWYLDGEPKKGIVAISSMWVKEGKHSYEVWVKEYSEMIKRLNPKKIFIYGEIPSNVNTDNVVQIQKFTDTRWK